MFSFEIHPRRHAAVSLAALTVGGLGLTACGSSSGGASSNSAGHAATTTAPGNATSHATTTVPANAAALRRALQAQAGHHTTTGPASAQSAAKAQALRNLLLHHRLTGQRPSPAAQSRAANAFRQALTRYAVCLRNNGVDIPSPNTSGKGPLLGTKGLKTNTPQFRSASAKCRSTLFAALRGAAPTTAKHG